MNGDGRLILDIFWEAMVISRIDSGVLVDCVHHVFGGRRGQAFKVVASQLGLGDMGLVPESLEDERTWKALFQLICAYDSSRLSSLTNYRFEHCGVDPFQCQVFNLFALTLAQIAVADSGKGVYLANSAPSLFSGASGGIRSCKGQFDGVCRFYLEMLSS